MNDTSRRWAIVTTRSRFGESQQMTRARLEELLAEVARVVPERRICVALLESETPWFAQVLARLPAENIIEQPIDRGTAVSVLVAFLGIFRRDPQAEVLIVTPTANQGLIFGSVARYHSNDAERTHDRMLVAANQGGHFSTGIASSSALLKTFSEAQPTLVAEVVDHLRRETRDQQSTLDGLYPFLPALDFEDDVLAACPTDVRGMFAPASARQLAVA